MSEDPLLQPIAGAEHREFAGLEIDVMAAGETRVKRLVHGVGGRWSEHVKPHVGMPSLYRHRSGDCPGVPSGSVRFAAAP